MPKTCNHPTCTWPVWGKGYCKSHQYLRIDLKEKKLPIFKPIRRASKKRAVEERQYSKDRIEFLSRPENKWCRVFPELEATTIHHAAGRIGKLLLDQRFWIPLSMPGHEWAETHPNEAKKIGISVNRLSVEQVG